MKFQSYAESECAFDCSEHGECIKSTGNCLCDSGYFDSNCGTFAEEFQLESKECLFSFNFETNTQNDELINKYPFEYRLVK